MELLIGIGVIAAVVLVVRMKWGSGLAPRTADVTPVLYGDAGSDSHHHHHHADVPHIDIGHHHQ